MKKLVLAAAAVTLVSGAASAADLPTAKGPPPAPVVYAPAFTWTGFYVGINAGGIWQDKNNDSSYIYDPYYLNNIYGQYLDGSENIYPTALPYLFGSSGSRSGWMVGGTVGYNYQFGVGSGFVIGVEADLDWLSSNSNNGAGYYSCTSPGCGFGLLPDIGGYYDYAGTYAAWGSRGSGNNYFGTVRARLGWAFDHFLVYATGGVAFGGNNSKGGGAINYWLPGASLTDTPDATFYVGRSSADSWGWTIGAGAEYAITNNWTIKAEYLYVSRSGGNNNNGYGGCVDNWGGDICGNLAANAAYWYANNKNDANANIVRLGVNYKF